VTGAYFTLEREGYGRMDKVITVTTASPAARQCEQLVWDTLQAADPDLAYEALRAVSAQELGNSKVTGRFILFMEKLLREYGRDYDIYLVLSGGRTSMAAAAMLAVQKYTFNRADLGESLHLFHLEVIEPELDERGKISRLAGMTPEERAYYLDPPGNAIALVEVPVVTLTYEPKLLWARLFEYATGDYLLEQQAYEQVRYSFHPDYLRNQRGLGEVDVYAEKRVDEASAAVGRVDRPKFRALLLQGFNKSDLRTLCFDLNIDYESLGGQGREGKVRELILYAERNGRVAEVIEACRQRRSHYSWDEAMRLQQTILCECKLRTGDDPGQKPIEVDVVRRLANKVVAVHDETGRPVTGWVVTNSPYAEPGAMALAVEKGILLYQARLPEDWKKRADWRIQGELKPLQTVPDA
jgi:hypothetical protein